MNDKCLYIFTTPYKVRGKVLFSLCQFIGGGGGESGQEGEFQPLVSGPFSGRERDNPVRSFGQGTLLPGPRYAAGVIPLVVTQEDFLAFLQV